MTTTHADYCLTHSLLRLLDYTTEGNGYTDTRQVLIYRVDGEEIGRSVAETHSLTMNPLFTKLVIEKILDKFPN